MKTKSAALQRLMVTARLKVHAQSEPDRVAIRFPRGRRGAGWDVLTYDALYRDIQRCAAGFRAQGLQPGDRVLLAFRPSIRFFGVAFGLMEMGAVPLFIDPAMGREAALQCLASVAPRGLIGPALVHLYRWWNPAPFASVAVAMTDGRGWPWGPASIAKFADVVDADMVRSSCGLDDPAVLVFTSGSTGPPKAVHVTHRCLAARVDRVSEMLGWRGGEAVVETLLVYTIMELALGMTVTVPQMDVTRPKTVDPQAVLEAIDSAKPRSLSASPVVWHRLVPHCEAVGARLDSLDFAVTSGAPIPVWLHERVMPLLREDVELWTPYGSTEALPLSSMGSREILAETAAKTEAGAGTCVGRLAAGIDVCIIEVTDEDLPTWEHVTEVTPGLIGEIVVAGDGVSPTYLQPPGADAGAKIDRDGTCWHRMGDLGYFDDQGRLWFCGRMSHRIRAAGGMIPCLPVEGVYNSTPGVYRTALVGWGEPGMQEPVLCVELEPGEDWSDSLEAVLAARARGTRWEGVVKHFMPHPGFPTDARHNSKIRREVLRDWVSQSRQTRQLMG